MTFAILLIAYCLIINVDRVSANIVLITKDNSLITKDNSLTGT